MNTKIPNDFIREKVAADLAAGAYKQIVTRFPPEPNGYLHVGHAKSICLNFGIAKEFNGICHIRMDDTNPAKEDVEYVESIFEDIHWLIDGWADHCIGLQGALITSDNDVQALPAKDGDKPFYASNYFPALYEYALKLIQKGKAYVCDLTPEEMDIYRGTPDQPGQESPFRNRSVEENLALFQKMRDGAFPDGAKTLRAKIDMQSPNIWMRDPVLYRIRHVEHHHVGNVWCIYPMYDFAHCVSDYIEGITHSICTLEFEVHRPLYDWILESLDLPRTLPHQYEFARLNFNYTVMSKRKLLQLVTEGIVNGWDDPRMPTIRGMRRRGVTAEVLRNLVYHIGITKYNSTTDIAVLEHAIRDAFNQQAMRRFAVLDPIKVIITNLPADTVREAKAVNHPSDETAGTRALPFTRELLIERDDFMENPPGKYFRLRPGGEVRLKYACIVKCDTVVKDADGNVTEIHCTADFDSWSGGPNSNRKVKGTIHWVSAAQGVPAEVRLYDRLFNVANPDADGDFKAHLNPHSLQKKEAIVEPALLDSSEEERFQFERLGYFCRDKDSRKEKPVFNRIVTLKDAWAGSVK